MMREPKSVLMIQTGGKHFESNPKFYFLLVQLSRKKLKLIYSAIDLYYKVDRHMSHHDTCTVMCPRSE